MARSKGVHWFDVIVPDNPIPYLLGYRICQYLGRYGSGKTLTAVAHTASLIYGGYASGVVSNIPLSIPKLTEVQRQRGKPSTWPQGYIILADEAWQYLFIDATPKQIKEFIAYLRKNSNILLLPSVLPLSRYIRALTVARYFNWQVFGLPYWWMTVEVPGERPGLFRISPPRYYGWYDTKALVDDTWYFYERVEPA